VTTATAVKETPILMQEDMVLGTLEGRKTNTRRLRGLEEVNADPDSWTLNRVDTLDAYCKPKYKGRFGAYFHRESKRELQIMPVVCPYGGPGDRLWVREAWNVRGLAFGKRPSVAAKIAAPGAWRYRATDVDWQHGWKPSIHMPRVASRLTLEITDVRVERLQDISIDDIGREGVQVPVNAEDDRLFIRVSGKFLPSDYLPDDFFRDKKPLDKERIDMVVKAHFASLWESINGPGSWAASPWVWCIAFRRIEA
jgi:hypothetical protein